MHTYHEKGSARNILKHLATVGLEEDELNLVPSILVVHLLSRVNSPVNNLDPNAVPSSTKPDSRIIIVRRIGRKNEWSRHLASARTLDEWTEKRGKGGGPRRLRTKNRFSVHLNLEDVVVSDPAFDLSGHDELQIDGFVDIERRSQYPFFRKGSSLDQRAAATRSVPEIEADGSLVVEYLESTWTVPVPGKLRDRISANAELTIEQALSSAAAAILPVVAYCDALARLLECRQMDLGGKEPAQDILIACAGVGAVHFAVVDGFSVVANAIPARRWRVAVFSDGFAPAALLVVQAYKRTSAWAVKESATLVVVAGFRRCGVFEASATLGDACHSGIVAP